MIDPELESKCRVWAAKGACLFPDEINPLLLEIDRLRSSNYKLLCLVHLLLEFKDLEKETVGLLTRIEFHLSRVPVKKLPLGRVMSRLPEMSPKARRVPKVSTVTKPRRISPWINRKAFLRARREGRV